MLIENAQTRASLKSAFDHLFRKYGRDFSDDDEIDLMGLEIVKGGKHIDKVQPRYFGSCFKRTEASASRAAGEAKSDRPTHPPARVASRDDDTYEDVFVQLSQRVRQASSFPLPPLHRRDIRPTGKAPGARPAAPHISKPKRHSGSSSSRSAPEGPRSREFGEVLWDIIRLEARSAGPVARVCVCNRLECFSCAMVNIAAS